MKIGYASLTYGVPETSLKTCMAKNATNERLREIISHNLRSLSTILDYNYKNGIKIFRISSSLIPFASSPINKLDWWNLFKKELDTIGKKLKETGIRVSMHPGQYTVLNSPVKEVVENSIKELVYHARLLDSLHTSSASKIVLHVGGVYGNKKEAMKRFVTAYQNLPHSVKNRLIIENDDVSYTIYDVLTLHSQTGAPVVYDNLHNQVLPSASDKGDAYWITQAGKTWKEKDGTQKIHYSQQGVIRKPGGHSQTIDLNVFLGFYRLLPYDIDIMLEVKDKNLSALKVLQLIEPERGTKGLLEEWERYKYSVLEYSPSTYHRIEKSMKDSGGIQVLPFYDLIDHALAQEKSINHTMRAFDRISTKLESYINEKEKKKYEGYLVRFQKGTLSEKAVKNLLFKFIQDNHVDPLLSSYFWYL